MSTMTMRKATRKKAKIKIALSGPAGSGKTYSALRLAFGITGDWSTIALIDTENGSGDLYSHLGEYNIIPMEDYSPESYIAAIQLCEREGIECAIIDSLTHEWHHCLEAVEAIGGNSYTAWGRVTPRHNKLVRAITSSKIHIISTTRKKQDYILEANSKGKMSPRKVGLKDVQREGMDYEFTLAFDLSMNHRATASKDRTSIFMNDDNSLSPFLITEGTGKQIKEWCEQGDDNPAFWDLSKQLKFIDGQLKNANNTDELSMIKETYPELFTISEIKALALDRYNELKKAA